VDDSHLRAIEMLPLNFWNWDDGFIHLEALLHDYMDHNPRAGELYAIARKLGVKSLELLILICK
jgi:hypothetical protein